MIEIYYNFTFLNEYIKLERGNKYAAAKVKRETTNALYYMLLGKKKIPTPCKMNFVWLIPNKRRDLDNICHAKKGILDSMVKAKLIPNDNLNHIVGFTDTYEISNKIGVRITHEEVSNG